MCLPLIISSIYWELPSCRERPSQLQLVVEAKGNRIQRLRLVTSLSTRPFMQVARSALGLSMLNSAGSNRASARHPGCLKQLPNHFFPTAPVPENYWRNSARTRIFLVLTLSYTEMRLNGQRQFDFFPSPM